MIRPKAVLFDLDGTIISSQGSNAFGRVWSWLVTKSFYHTPALYALLETGDAVLRVGYRYPLVAGIGPLLAELKAEGIVLGVVTDRSRLSVARYFSLRREICLGDFAVIHTRRGPFDFLADLGRCHHFTHRAGKNSRTFAPILKLFLGKYGIGREWVVYVGDTVADFHAAWSAGIMFFASTWGRARAHEFQALGLPEQCILGSPGDLIALVGD